MTLAEARTHEGRRLVLSEQDGAFAISLNGQELMHSRAHASEDLLGELGVLAGLESEAVVDVAELLPAVVDWNRSYLQGLNGTALDDSRVQLHVGDAAKLIQKAKPGTYDAVMLDLDNGPVAMVASSNKNIYSKMGLLGVKRVLKPGGRAIFWSASIDAAFETRLKNAGFSVEAVPAKVHARAKRDSYILYVAE
ncbi:MAG: spermine/spermidine synthase domain-containing protein [Verrucomicrobiia bacterium]